MLIEETRLEFARLRRGLKKSELAKEAGISYRTLTGLGKDLHEPTEETIQGLESALGFSRSFFEGDPMELPGVEAVSFRSLSRMSAETRDMARSAGALGECVIEWMEKRFGLPPTDLPDLRNAEPEQAARELRAEWNLSDRPIKNLLGRAEAKGVRVFSLEENSLDVDAFCFWRDSTPLVFLNTMKSAEHSRFDLAHELGHLVLHREGEKQGKAVEKEANSFASAFLMPASDIAVNAPRNPTMKALIRAKKRWGVSLVALIYRMHDRGLISDWQYRQLMIEAAEAGYKTQEPEPMDHEVSMLLTKVHNAMRTDGLSLKNISDDLRVPEEEIKKLFLRLALVPIDGGRRTTPPKGFNPEIIEGGLS